MGKGSVLNVGLWSRLIGNFKLLYSLIKDYWKGEYREVSPWSILVFFAGIIYVISPIDIIPDFLPLVGQIDDALILILCMYFLEKDLHKYKNGKSKSILNSIKPSRRIDGIQRNENPFVKKAGESAGFW